MASENAHFVLTIASQQSAAVINQLNQYKIQKKVSQSNVLSSMNHLFVIQMKVKLNSN